MISPLDQPIINGVTGKPMTARRALVLVCRTCGKQIGLVRVTEYEARVYVSTYIKPVDRLTRATSVSLIAAGRQDRVAWCIEDGERTVPVDAVLHTVRVGRIGTRRFPI